jgi:hypothetical protein
MMMNKSVSMGVVIEQDKAMKPSDLREVEQDILTRYNINIKLRFTVSKQEVQTLEGFTLDPNTRIIILEILDVVQNVSISILGSMFVYIITHLKKRQLNPEKLLFPIKGKMRGIDIENMNLEDDESCKQVNDMIIAFDENGILEYDTPELKERRFLLDWKREMNELTSYDEKQLSNWLGSYISD